MREISDTTAKQLRAYLITEGGKLLDWAAPNMQTVVNIKNMGQTPAYDVSIVSLAMIVDYPFKNGQAPVSFGSAPLLREVFGTKNKFVVIGPGEVIQTSAIPSEPFTPDEIKDVIVNKKKAYVVVGAVYYKDAFGGTHFTHFCKLATGNSILIGSGADSMRFISVCAEGNDSN